MIWLYIIGGLVLLIALLLSLPITAQIEFKEEFFVKIKYLGITVYKIKPDGKQTKTAEKEEKPQTKALEKEDGTFTKLRKKHGFKGAVKEILSLILDILKATKKHFLRVKIRKVKLDLIVVGSDAAQTAVEYGAICGFVYPILSLMEQNLNIKYKNINIEAGFKHTDSQFGISADIKANSVLLLIIAVKVLKEYKNFSVRNELQ